MAAGQFVIPNLTRLNLFSATALLSANTSNFRAALVTSSWTPNNATDELWSAASSNEVPNGNGYTTGGVALSSVVLSQTSGVVSFISAAVVWTASGSGIPAWRRLVIYYLGTLNSKVNPLVAHCLGDSTPADIPLTTSGNTITMTPNASGIISAS